MLHLGLIICWCVCLHDAGVSLEMRPARTRRLMSVDYVFEEDEQSGADSPVSPSFFETERQTKATKKTNRDQQRTLKTMQQPFTSFDSEQRVNPKK